MKFYSANATFDFLRVDHIFDNLIQRFEILCQNNQLAGNWKLKLKSERFGKLDGSNKVLPSQPKISGISVLCTGYFTWWKNFSGQKVNFHDKPHRPKTITAWKVIGVSNHHSLKSYRLRHFISTACYREFELVFSVLIKYFLKILYYMPEFVGLKTMVILDNYGKVIRILWCGSHRSELWLLFKSVWPYCGLWVHLFRRPWSRRRPCTRNLPGYKCQGICVSPVDFLSLRHADVGQIGHNESSVWLVDKGQLISKGFFGVFNSSKKRTKTSRPEVS